MKRIIRNKLSGHLGIWNEGYKLNIDGKTFLGVYWICNIDRKNIFAGKKSPQMYFWNDIEDLKIFETGRLPRKLKKKISKYYAKKKPINNYTRKASKYSLKRLIKRNETIGN